MSHRKLTPYPHENLEKLNKCARQGNVQGLFQLDPHIFQNIEEIKSFVSTPLHIAAEEGNTRFAIEILRLVPHLGRVLDPSGLSPLHVALKHSKNETALALARHDISLVRVKGFGGYTPLLYAARYHPNVDVLVSFLMKCPEAINDLNNHFQSALHLVVENGDKHAINVVLGWLVRTSRGHVIGLEDDKCNTALHLAARHGCVEAVERMVGVTELHKLNSDKQTPLDVAIESGNENVAKILRTAIAKQNMLEKWVRVFVCLVFLAFSYLIAMKAISEDTSVAWVLFGLSCSLLLVAFISKML